MEIKEIKIFRPSCNFSSEFVSAKVFLKQDITGLLPYVKGALSQSKYFPHGPFLKLMFKGHLVTIDRDCVALAKFPDNESARECAQELLDLLDDIEKRKDSIAPDTTPFNPPAVMDIFKLLPRKAGCGKCGYPTCMAFAAALSREEAEPERCPETGGEVLRQLMEMLGPGSQPPRGLE